ncbi:MAG: rod shape-determining protein MreC [Fimbriimonadaceae bacterium]
MDNARRDWLVLLALCVLAAILGAAQAGARKSGSIDLASNMIQSAVNPVSGVLNGAVDGIGTFTRSVLSASELVEKNRRLEQMARASAAYGNAVARLQREVESLRQAIGLEPAAGRQKIYAEIIGYFPSEDRITISAGANQGVAKRSPVLTGDGMVGIVSTVGASHSQVTLLSSAQLKIGAIVDRNPPAAGLLRGLSPSELLLEIPDTSAPVQAGDLVLTSGFGVLPRGIPVGKVFEVENDAEFGKRTARVLPLVQIGNVREVVVLR